MKKTLFLSIILSFAFSLLNASNMLKNPGFEDLSDNKNFPSNWIITSASSTSLETADGSKVLKLSNTTSPQYIEANQTIPIDSEKIKVITVKAKIKISNVIKGEKDWEMARVMVLFFDKNGTQVGDWPELGRWKGTFDWSQKINIINVPVGATSIKLQVQLSNALGEMWADDISIEAGDNLDIPRLKNDFVINGSMEYGATLPFYWGGWLSGEGSFESPGYKSSNCFKITNKSKGYSMITQQIPIDDKKVASINLSGYVKVSGVVQGSNNWEKARISIEFHNALGERLGGWPPVAGEAAYDINEWTLWSKDYPVPAGTTNIVIGAGLLDCSGTMWFDDIKVTALDKKGSIVKPEIIKAEDMTKWFPFTAEEDTYKAGAIIDFSEELDKPAGKHGELIISKTGSLIFADGTSARFWGTNIVAGDIFRNHADTDKMVKRLSKLGVNMVRLHHMDAWWANPGIINYGDTTSTLSTESLEKLDYLIFKLKEAGIYIFMDMLVHRKVAKGDGIENHEKVPAGFKEVIYFDEKLQDLTKEYIKQLLTHINQYTKTSYKDEQAIVMTEIVNESTLFYFDRNADIPQFYRAKLDTLFNDYLKARYKNMPELKDAWNKLGVSDLSNTEDFNKNNMTRAVFNYNYEDWTRTGSTSCGGRTADTKDFYYQTELAFFKNFYDFIHSLDTKILITGSNHWEKWDADLKANASLDFIDRHSYWDHPSGGWTMQENISFTNAPMIKSKLNCVAELGHSQVLGKPFTVTEYNSLIPNEYRAGFPLIMASYSRLNGWDAMLQFNFSNFEWKNILAHFADFSVCPDMLSSWSTAYYIYNRNYVKTSPEKLVDYVSDDSLFANKNSSFKLINNDLTTPLMIRSYKTFDLEKSDKKYNPKLTKNAALSLTQQLYWNFSKGVFQIYADKIQGVAGFIKAEKDGFKFRNFRVKSTNLYASIFASSIDGLPLASASKILLNTVARMDNTGTKYSPAHTSVIYGGSAPILLEPVYSELKFTLSKFKSVKVYTLDANNYIKEEYKNFTVPDNNTVMMKTDENSKTLNYFIEVKR
ncbi:MAG: beta-galactosidase [bacterium]